MATVLHIIPTLAQGGAEKVLVDVVTRTTTHKHVVVLLENVPDFYKLPDGVEVYRLSIPTKWRRSWLPLLWAKAKFAAAILRAKPSVVVGWSDAGMKAACAMQYLFGIKAAWSVHDSIDPVVLDGEWHKKRLQEYSTLRPDVIHYPTQAARIAYEARGVSSTPGVVIHHGIDETFLSVGETRRRKWQTVAN